MVLTNIICLVLAPPLFIGIIEKTKSILTGRCGASIFQIYFDIIKLLKKSIIYSENSTCISKVGPVVICVMVMFSTIFIPQFNGVSLYNFTGDFILFAVLIGGSKWLMIMIAMESGSSFQSMGVSRELKFSLFIEATIIFTMISLGIISGTWNFLSITQLYVLRDSKTLVLMVLIVAIFFILLLVEGSRMPIDDPNTHLELTMIHEVMILDVSGTDLALMIYSNSLKLYVFSFIIVNAILPHFQIIWLGVCCDFLVLIVISIAIGFVEATYARIRFTRVSEFILLAFVASFILFILTLYMNGVK